MNTKRMMYLIVLSVMLILALGAAASAKIWAGTEPGPDEARFPRQGEDPGVKVMADDPSQPDEPVKLIFIHHSCGGHWLANLSETEYPAGGLGQALMDNNYFVSATNYGWGPGGIGSNTDIPNRPNWFTDTVMTQVYAETGQNICGDSMCFGNWTRMASDPGGPNQIIMFKSCYPNSDLYGNPDDLPLDEPNDQYTVANAKAVYNHILTYFKAHQEKLFVVITAPPMTEASYVNNDHSTPAGERATNARAFNDWLVNDWLSSNGYTYTNVAVFDFYNVLTSNGSDARIDDTSIVTEPHDYDLRPDGNHHYWNGSQIIHTQTVASNFAAYPTFSVPPTAPDLWCDDHPTAVGNQKATAEFVPLLNVFYNRWQGGATCTPLTGVTINGSTTGYTNTAYAFHASLTPSGASSPVTYTWDPAPDAGQTSASVTYTWATTGTKTITLTAENCGGSGSSADTHAVAIRERGNYRVYLPLVLRDYAAAAPACAVPLTGVTISGATTGYTGTLYTFTAAPTPANATTPVAYTWTPAPQSGQGTSSASYQWAATGAKTVSVTASNCAAAHTASDDHVMTIQAAPSGDLVQPGDFTYLGAFRLPDREAGAPDQEGWEYSGGALTHYPDGDSGGDGDGHPGSLFGTGHNVHNYVSEVSIPAPTDSSNVAELNYAETIQGFADVRGGLFDALTEMPRVGIQYLPAQTGQSSAKLHLSWGAHHQDEGSPTHTPSHAWCDLTLPTPNTQGAWWMGEATVERLYRANDYIFEIPSTWADAHLGGARLATGRYRDGGWSGMGPNIFAYGPWLDSSPLVSGTVLTAHELLAYSYSGGDHTLDYYHDSDDWTGGAWLTAGSRSAVVFVGTKGGGDYWWYGYASPAGDGVPCVWFPDEPWEGDPACFRSSDGSSCVDDFPEGSCTGYVEMTKGWWSSRADAQIIFYDPADFAAVESGTMEPYEPQPYARLDIDDHLLLDWPVGTETDCGSGDQRKCRTGAIAYDRERGFLYVLELFADNDKPLVHVWQVE